MSGTIAETEDKVDKFERLAESRMQKTLNGMRLIGNLSSPQYAYTPAHVEQIVTALEDAIQAYVVDKFNKTTKTENGFSFHLKG